MEKLPHEKLNVRLIALDLDDTLLNSEAKIENANVFALQEVAQRGIYVVLCSGRAEDGILPFVRRLDIAGLQTGRFLIAINGCSVFDMHLRRQIYSKNVESEILIEANKEAEATGLRSEVYSPDIIFYREATEWTKKDVDLCHLKGMEIPNYEEFLASKSFPKMLIPGEPQKLLLLQEKLKSKFGKKAVIFTSKPYFLEILPPECGKGEAISWLSHHIGINCEQTMGFGDSMNDESMMKLCGIGVCMQNGLDYIKNCAKFVTEKDNNHCGVADFLQKYVL